MIRDWVDALLVSVIVIGLCLITVLFFFASGAFNDCESRGGTPIETKRGWVCAKIERV